MDHGFPRLFVASIFGLTGLLSVVGRIGFGIAADRIGRATSATISYGCTAVGTLCLLGLEIWPLAAALYAYAIFFGLGFGARGPIITAMASQLFPGRFGAIYGFLSVGNGIGGGVAPWFAGYVHDLTGSYRIAFLISVGFCAVGAGCFWLARPPGPARSRYSLPERTSGRRAHHAPHVGNSRRDGPRHRWQCACTPLTRHAKPEAPPRARNQAHQQGQATPVTSRVVHIAVRSTSGQHLALDGDRVDSRPASADQAADGRRVRDRRRHRGAERGLSARQVREVGRGARRRADRRRRDRPHHRAPLARDRRSVTRSSSACTARRARGWPPRAIRRDRRDREDRARRGDRRATSSASTATCSRRRDESPTCSTRELEAAHARRARAAWSSSRRAPLAASTPGPCLRFPRPGSVPPAAYLARARRARSSGTAARIFTGVHASAVERRQRRARHDARGRAGVTAGAVDRRRPTRRSTSRMALHTKQAAYRTYVIGAQRPGAARCRAALYWDTAGSVPLRAPAAADARGADARRS